MKHWRSPENSLLDKSAMFDISPFGETLYLDCDAQVMDRLDFGFSQAGRFGLACCICECPRARRYGEWHRAFWGPLKIWHSHLQLPAGMKDFPKQPSGEQKVPRFLSLPDRKP
jgi:hypothetical protein